MLLMGVAFIVFFVFCPISNPDIRSLGFVPALLMGGMSFVIAEGVAFLFRGKAAGMIHILAGILIAAIAISMANHNPISVLTSSNIAGGWFVPIIVYGILLRFLAD